MLADAEAAVDRRRASPHVPQSLPGCSGLGREALAVVFDDDEPLARGASANHDLGAGCIRVAPDIPQALLDDAEDLDLLVRSEADRGVDLEVDRKLAIGS